jgi:hypothetical protein
MVYDISFGQLDNRVGHALLAGAALGGLGAYHLEEFTPGLISESLDWNIAKEPSVDIGIP